MIPSMARETVRDLIRSVERSEPVEQWTVLCYLAGRSVPLDGDELNGAIRRAELLLAAGGDPRRRLALGSRAVGAVASDLDDPERRAALAAGLEVLREEADGLRGATEALTLLLRDGDLAWQVFAMSLVAEALADDGE
jgi:hypothetical protein